MYGFGIVGCGVIAPTHADAISRLDNAELVAVCDLDEQAGKAFAEKYNCEYYKNIDDMVARDDIFACNILTPSGLHAKLGKVCAEAGKHVICTKPIDITLEAIDGLLKTAEAHGVKVAATHQLRSYPVYRRIKSYIDDGKFGRLLYGNAILPWYRPEEYYSQSWQGTWSMDGGGALMNQSIHFIDLLVWFMGSAARICGFADHLDHDIETEDCGTAAVKFVSGAQGIIQGTTCTYKGHPARIEIHGTKGNAVIIGDDVAVWQIEGEEEIIDHEAGTHLTASSDPKAGMQENAVIAHMEQIGDVISAVEENREPVLNGEEARRAVEVILGIYQSSQNGTMVKLL
jgi:UDP-N-acetyl-2-amino-2-deoxyglucuronate dehydrogenase